MKIMIVFQCLLELQKIDFWTNLAPSWPKNTPNINPPALQNGGQKRSQNGLGSEVGSRTDFETILDRFGTHFGRFWDDSGRFWDDFWAGSLVDFCVISEPNRTEPNRTDPNRAEPNRTEPNRTEQNRT